MEKSNRALILVNKFNISTLVFFGALIWLGFRKEAIGLVLRNNWQFIE